MGTVARQEKLGDSSITISFESYEDFLDFQKKEREQDALDVVVENNKLQEFIDAFNAPKSYHRLELTKEEYYYLSCILGHLVPAGEVSKSLIDKVGSTDLDCGDFDRVILSATQIQLVENR